MNRINRFRTSVFTASCPECRAVLIVDIPDDEPLACITCGAPLRVVRSVNPYRRVAVGYLVRTGAQYDRRAGLR